MMNQTGMSNGMYGNASPNQTATSGFMPGNKSMLSIADVDDADTTATSPMTRKSRNRKKSDDDDEPGLASLREDLRMWSTSGTEVGKHILEKMEKVERTVRIIEKTGERHSEILARQKSDEGTDKILAELKVLKAAVDGIQETQQETLTMHGQDPRRAQGVESGSGRHPGDAAGDAHDARGPHRAPQRARRARPGGAHVHQGRSHDRHLHGGPRAEEDLELRRRGGDRRRRAVERKGELAVPNAERQEGRRGWQGPEGGRGGQPSRRLPAALAGADLATMRYVHQPLGWSRAARRVPLPALLGALFPRDADPFPQGTCLGAGGRADLPGRVFRTSAPGVLCSFSGPTRPSPQPFRGMRSRALQFEHFSRREPGCIQACSRGTSHIDSVGNG